jgi:hypothetical protein
VAGTFVPCSKTGNYPNHNSVTITSLISVPGHTPTLQLRY